MATGLPPGGPIKRNEDGGGTQSCRSSGALAFSATFLVTLAVVLSLDVGPTELASNFQGVNFDAKPSSAFSVNLANATVDSTIARAPRLSDKSAAASSDSAAVLDESAATAADVADAAAAATAAIMSCGTPPRHPLWPPGSPLNCENWDKSTSQALEASLGFVARETAEHEKDVGKVWELHGLISPLADKNTVIVIPTNLGYLELALNLRCRLLTLNATNVLLWALDVGAKAKLDAMGILSFYDKLLFSTSTARRYGHPEFVAMMRERPRVWWQIVATGFDMIFVDADTVAFQSWEKWFPMKNDIEVQLDGREGWDSILNATGEPLVCSGVFWAKSSSRTLEFFEYLANKIEECEGWGLHMSGKLQRCDDQLAFDHAIRNPQVASIVNRAPPTEDKTTQLNDIPSQTRPVNAYMQDATVVLSGHLARRAFTKGRGYDARFFYRKHYNNRNEKLIKFSPAIVHYNGYGSFADKKWSIKKFRWWELTDSHECQGRQH